MAIRSFESVVQLAYTLPQLRSMTRQEFIHWLINNEPTYREFYRFAMKALEAGRTRFSVYQIREAIRWWTNVETTKWWDEHGEFKISNNVTPYVARLLIKDEPRLASILTVKDVDMYPMGDTA